ncbi:hypothetical protein JXA85_00960 [Candidatus Woesearchaeota archaeon]|nr:hypothetical protein [Candidatus Woesearchaeota archaeon]
MNRLLRLNAILLFGLVLASFVVLAGPANITELKKLDSQRATISATAETDDALAGNVTELLVNMTSITNGWQGYYGNITGEIVLDDASSNSMYTWSITTSGEIYATRNTSLNWSAGNILCANETAATTENTRIFGSANAGDSDNVTQTFSRATHPAIITNGNTLAADSCSYSLSTYASDAVDANLAFNETLLWSVSDSGAVYTSIINNDKTGFTGASYDFQLLVAEDGHGNSAATTYYFFIELG